MISLIDTKFDAKRRGNRVSHLWMDGAPRKKQPRAPFRSGKGIGLARLYKPQTRLLFRSSYAFVNQNRKCIELYDVCEIYS